MPLTLPFFQKLESAQNILIAGAGGGFDFFGGLPLYLALRKAGKAVHLANFSFTDLKAFKGDRLTPFMMRVTPDTRSYDGLYFPEWYLSRWLKEVEGLDVPIYAFEKTGVMPLIDNYKILVEKYGIDTILLVDGGTDSLMRGDEDGLGTPVEDLTSIAAVHALDVPTKLLVCIGFGVDHYHGVSNDLTFEAIADLTESGAYLGAYSLLESMPEVQKYRAAVEYTHQKMPIQPSIVSASILTALEGQYGNVHATERTRGSRLWINPLMALYWTFELSAVVDRHLFVEELMLTEHFDQVWRSIMLFQSRHHGRRRRGPLPD